ncbi:Aste57867_23565 [Aphanomyces stellatus]|uniref:Aste57867_23565 protein n=1 Tax=Aphanomyces stellatus TaxID=120398 RepID=A0A485LN58_9STRA|nr:hypothetical protein As57867_023494 [Aphanomyces stellatus]VFU00210.1 Aste57867_23565 [Aphanomyces stellatus]
MCVNKVVRRQTPCQMDSQELILLALSRLALSTDCFKQKRAMGGRRIFSLNESMPAQANASPHRCCRRILAPRIRQVHERGLHILLERMPESDDTFEALAGPMSFLVCVIQGGRNPRCLDHA